MSRTTIMAGLRELALPEEERVIEANRIRRPGGDRVLPVGGNIMKFLDLRLLRKLEDYPWTERKNPLGGN